MDSPSLSIIVASSGRPTLARTLESARSQMREGDEILVSINTDCPWGHAARNQLMSIARGDALCFMDDDDIYADGALDVIRARFAEASDRLHLFRLRYTTGDVLWTDREVRCGNVSTQIVVVPEIAPFLVGCDFGDRYIGDFDFISACADRLEVAWHEEVVCLVRPE